MFIGLTGGIASGKNFIAGLFQEKGCYTLDADFVSREVMRHGGRAFDAILKHFTSSILNSEGEIDRSILRKKVVGNREELRVLESIVHPCIDDYSSKWYRSIKGKDDKAIAVYHAPLIIESGLCGRFDDIILIYASKESQIERLRRRGTPPVADALKLMDTQLPYEEKLKFADHIIDNDSGAELAEKEVARVLNLLKIFQYTGRINRRNTDEPLRS